MPTCMPDAKPFYRSVLNLRDPALSEIHSSTISVHHAKEGYGYPTIRLPHTLFKACRTSNANLSDTSQRGACLSSCCSSSHSAPKDEVGKSRSVVNDPASSVFTQPVSSVRTASSPLFSTPLIRTLSPFQGVPV